MELRTNQKIDLRDGGSVTVLKPLGRGGQGIVYLVELGGKKMALKWYLKPLTEAFSRNLEYNVFHGAPSDAFLWPEHLTVKDEEGCCGYIMRLRPEGYYEFGNFLLAKVRASKRALIRKTSSMEASSTMTQSYFRGESEFFAKHMVPLSSS